MCFRVGKRRGEEEFSEQAKQAVVQNHPAPFTANCKYRLSLVLMTDQPQISEVPTTTSLGLINLLEQLTEPRETFSFVDDQVIVKGCDAGSVVVVPGDDFLPIYHVFPSPQARNLRFWVLWRLHYIGMVKSLTIHDWAQSPSPLPSLERGSKTQAPSLPSF